MTHARIIIADDMEPILLYLESILAKQKEFEIVAKAKDGYELIELVKKYNPELVITDIEMPKCSGLQAIEELNKLELQTKYVILTGNNTTSIVKQKQNMRIVQIIQKPIVDESKFISKIKEAIKIEIEEQKEEKKQEKIENNIQLTRNKKENIFKKILSKIFGGK